MRKMNGKKWAPQPYDLVCPFCGSDDLRIADSHGWMRCEDCSEEEHAIHREDYEEH